MNKKEDLTSVSMELKLYLQKTREDIRDLTVLVNKLALNIDNQNDDDPYDDEKCVVNAEIKSFDVQVDFDIQESPYGNLELLRYGNQTAITKVTITTEDSLEKMIRKMSAPPFLSLRAKLTIEPISDNSEE